LKQNAVGQTSLDLDALRTFVLGTELGSYRAASSRLGRSQPALSAHLKKLEEQVGVPIVKKSGRGLVLTGAGESLYAHGRRLLALSDEAIAAAVSAEQVSGSVRFGLAHDFAEGWLPKIVGRFARLHPDVAIEVHADETSALIKHLEIGLFDFIIAWGDSEKPNGQVIAELPMQWIGPGEGDVRRGPDDPLPLVLGDAPSRFRTAAIQALDEAQKPWRLAFSSPSPSGLWGAVAAGLGVSVRTRFGLPGAVRIIGAAEAGLPTLPTIKLSIYHAGRTPTRAAAYVMASVQDALAESLATPGHAWRGWPPRHAPNSVEALT
jgi:DNA-binding transcriptional LysR family regulator